MVDINTYGMMNLKTCETQTNEQTNKQKTNKQTSIEYPGSAYTTHKYWQHLKTLQDSHH